MQAAALKGIDLLEKYWRRVWPNKCLLIDDFDKINDTVDDVEAGQCTVMLRVRNASRETIRGVRVRIERVSPTKDAGPAATENAKQFVEHPLRRTRDFGPKEESSKDDPESFDIVGDSREEVLFCFRRRSVPEDRGGIYFSAPWGKYRFGEVFLPLGGYVVTVAARADGFETSRKTLLVEARGDYGLSVRETVSPIR